MRVGSNNARIPRGAGPCPAKPRSLERGCTGFVWGRAVPCQAPLVRAGMHSLQPAGTWFRLPSTF